MPKHTLTQRDLVALRLAGQGKGELSSRALQEALCYQSQDGARKMIYRLAKQGLVEQYAKRRAAETHDGGHPLHMYRLTKKGRSAL
jgi:predicted ArsR family transcriptional regulator